MFALILTLTQSTAALLSQLQHECPQQHEWNECQATGPEPGSILQMKYSLEFTTYLFCIALYFTMSVAIRRYIMK